MKILNLILFFGALLFQSKVALSQSNSDCLKEVFAFEEKVNFRNDSLLKNKTIFLNYSVLVTDWENQLVSSNTKIYKNEDYMHFFSEQANIYQDSKEVVMIMPQQRIAIISSTNKELNNTKISSAFFEIRKGFIDSCEIIRCEKNGSKKILELKTKNSKLANNIVGIVYEYDVEIGKILSAKISYNQSYKVKQIQINYKDYNTDSKYQFASSRRYLIDKNGKILSKLNGYELVDNRDQKKKSKNK